MIIANRHVQILYKSDSIYFIPKNPSVPASYGQIEKQTGLFY